MTRLAAIVALAALLQIASAEEPSSQSVLRKRTTQTRRKSRRRQKGREQEQQGADAAYDPYLGMQRQQRRHQNDRALAGHEGGDHDHSMSMHHEMCSFCPEGLTLDPSTLLPTGDVTCGFTKDYAAGFEADHALCSTIQLAQAFCCPTPVNPIEPVPENLPEVDENAWTELGDLIAGGMGGEPTTLPEVDEEEAHSMPEEEDHSMPEEMSVPPAVETPTGEGGGGGDGGDGTSAKSSKSAFTKSSKSKSSKAHDAKAEKMGKSSKSVKTLKDPKKAKTTKVGKSSKAGDHMAKAEKEGSSDTKSGKSADGDAKAKKTVPKSKSAKSAKSSKSAKSVKSSKTSKSKMMKSSYAEGSAAPVEEAPVAEDAMSMVPLPRRNYVGRRY